MKKTQHKILIVEDEKPMAKALALKFEHNGFDVKNAYDGREALSILKEEKFDVIVMDLIMPHMDGFKLMEELKKTKDKTPVFVLTNLSQDEDKKKLAELGAHEFFIKSNISIKQIVDEVERFLAK
ncbi:MAG TPA: response regulator [Candidatus Paceibacterota bacterium]|nr:response regulator [Candidatus Paceibacterota bacterium]